MRMLIFLVAIFAATAQTVDEGAREIWDLGFRAKRPPTSAIAPTPAGRPLQYHPVPGTAPRSQIGAMPATPKQTVGITLWQLLPWEARDAGVPRLLLQDAPSGKMVEYVPHRIRLDQPLHDGDRVRVAIEFPQEGFLYVVDRERYRDGALGDPYLI